MFIAIFIVCLAGSNGQQECKVKTNPTPFYTKKECVLATEAVTKEEFKCLKVGGKK